MSTHQAKFKKRDLESARRLAAKKARDEARRRKAERDRGKQTEHQDRN